MTAVTLKAAPLPIGVVRLGGCAVMSGATATMSRPLFVAELHAPVTSTVMVPASPVTTEAMV